MEYRHLGRLGVVVSPLCLGTMNFGPRTPEADSHEIMDAALDAGVNFFDTANGYGGGETEQIIGRWFAQGGNRREKVVLLTTGLNKIAGFRTLDPTATFYVFPNVAAVCNRLGITSHGLALYLLEGADETFGVACLGGECFGEAGAGFLRFSCAEPNDRLQQALDFLPVAISRTERVAAYLARHPKFRLPQPYG